MKVYYFSPETFEYVSQGDAPENPAVRGTYMVPGNATTVPVPTSMAANTTPVFVNGAWQVQDDYRGFSLWDIGTAMREENNLDLGDPLPRGKTNIAPPDVPFPTWDGTKWVNDSAKQAQYDYEFELNNATQHLEDALKLLEDNGARKTVAGLRVMSTPDEAALKQYILDMQDYVDLVVKTGTAGIGTMNVNEPSWPLTGQPTEMNVGVFTSQNAGPTAGIQSVPWQAGTHFEAGQLVYGTNNEGLFVAPAAFTSNPQMQTDITQGNLMSVMPQVSDLRHAPVADIAALAALPAQDYAICKVKTTGDEYVFNAGAVSGDVRDNNNTGFWSLVASPSVGQYRTYTGAVAGTGTASIVIGAQPFNPNFELVFVNGNVRVDSEYSVDWTTGTITLNVAMNVNDTWKVLVMS